MKKLISLAAIALLGVLAACGTVVRSNVTTFQEWPATIADKTYAFEAPAAHDDTLEYRSYQDLVRGELKALGFAEAPGKAALTVSMRFSTAEQPIRVIEITDPYLMSPWYGRPGYWGPYRRPFYDPFWPRSARVSSDELENVYQRQLQVAIKDASGKRLFDVTVQNLSKQASTPALMPALVHSAFVGFPGPNGVARKVELKQEG